MKFPHEVFALMEAEYLSQRSSGGKNTIEPEERSSKEALMQRQNLRVLIAGEKSRVRNLFRRAAETEGGATVIGEAETATGLLTMARNVRPDVVLMDLYLPGGGLPDARMSGLDAAQSLATDLPEALVLNVYNPDNLRTPTPKIALRTDPLIKDGSAGPV